MTGIILIATGKYQRYINQMFASIVTHWKDPHTFLFTDDISSFGLLLDSITPIKIPHEPWPYPTLNRYKHICKNEEIFKDCEHLFYVDVDARFVADVSPLDYLVAVRHCGYYFGQQGPQEVNTNSVFYGIKFLKYFGGGFQGGRRNDYLNACQWCYNMIEQDGENGIIPIHNDETAWNSYLNDIQSPTLELTPDYHYPDNPEYFRDRCWNGNDFEPKLLLLSKDHEYMRS